MWKFSCAFIIFCLVADTQAQRSNGCLLDSDCGSGECCQMPRRNSVISKRGPVRPEPSLVGICKAYIIQGDPCKPSDMISGSCGCEPGTACMPHLTFASLGKRGFPPINYYCQGV